MLELIMDADLNTATPKIIRSQLEVAFGRDLSHRREEINSMIKKAIENRVRFEAARSLEDSDFKLAQQLQEAENRPQRTRVRLIKEKRIKESQVKRNNPFNSPYILSEPLSNLLGGVRALTRPQAVKQIWAYVKEHKLQDPSNKQFIICDDPLKAVLRKARIRCFEMNRILSHHLMSHSEVAGSPQHESTQDDVQVA